MMLRLILTAAALFSTAALAAPPDLDAINRINDAAFNHGQVVETAAYLTDHIGGRLTNSPSMREAERWTLGKFREWGLDNPHLEGFPFGRGWWIASAHATMLTPRRLELRSIPVAWTPATKGPLAAPIIVAPMKRERDFAEWKGKLAGKIVLISYPAPLIDQTSPRFQRLTDQDLAALDVYQQPNVDPTRFQKLLPDFLFPLQLDRFLKEEGALAWARMSERSGGLVHGEGYTHKVGQTPSLPGVELAPEDYRRLARLAKAEPVSLEIDNDVRFEDADHNAYNVIADLPGREPKAGYVMAGAHLDSWVAGDGAADNAAGSAIVMEAARILSSLGIKPKRTIRFALWAGEEQGLWGSFNYVQTHLVRRTYVSDPIQAAQSPYWATNTYPVTPLPGYRDLDVYFNIDNGGGKIRGIYTEGNLVVVPIFKEWLAPFASMGASAVVAQPTGDTDHVHMTRLGLPAFQFIQDPLDYNTLVHHSNIDTFDHLRSQDLRQAAVILASLLLSAADADQPLPRKVLPTKPKDSDPFRYPNPDDR